MNHIEIERKFLVKDGSWRAAADAGRHLEQGYLPSAPGTTVRVRRTPEGGFLTLKGQNFDGFSRREFEYPIPEADAAEMLHLFCAPLIVSKNRYHVIFAGECWEVDVFEGGNAPLILAELELEKEDSTFAIPPWLGREVTGEACYGNGALAAHPFSTWEQEKNANASPLGKTFA